MIQSYIKPYKLPCQVIREKQKAFLEEYNKKEEENTGVATEDAPRNLLETEHDPDIMF